MKKYDVTFIASFAFTRTVEAVNYIDARRKASKMALDGEARIGNHELLDIYDDYGEAVEVGDVEEHEED